MDDANPGDKFEPPSDMTGAELGRILESLGWTADDLGHVMRCGERIVRRWLNGQLPIPESAGRYIRALANPPPTDRWRWRHKPPAGETS